MTEPIDVTIDYDELGFRKTRYPWWLLKSPGDILILRGALLEVRKVQTLASIYAARHGMRFATRNVSEAGTGVYAVQVYFQCRK